VRFVERFVDGGEAAAFFRRADLAVLPYREIEGSGVLATALAFGLPLLLTDVGSFPEVAATGAAELVPPGDPGAMHEALAGLVDDPARRDALAAASAAAAAGPYAWGPIAERHLALYARLVG
jgi:glycosyltransferase involved in cell wall biosynthesis